MMNPGTGTWQALVVWVTSYVFFLLTLANNLSASHDSINYLLHITRGDHLFHQHHLLYHFFARQWLMLFSSQPQHLIIESFTALWGSGVMTVCYLFFRNRFQLSGLLSAAGVCVIAFSYGPWFYSVNIEVYMPPIFFVLLSLYIMTRSENNHKDVWVVSLLHSAAILFHQVNVLFIPVVLFWIVNTFPHKRPVLLARYMIAGLLLSGSVYLFVGYFNEGHRQIETLAKWLAGYTIGHDYWKWPGTDTPLKVMAGFCRAMVGAQFIFQLPPVKTFLVSSFASHSLEDEIFLTAKMPATVAWILTVATMLLGAVVAILVTRFIAIYRSARNARKIFRPLVLTVIFYSLFFIFWMPEIPDFWILQVILMWILLIGTISNHRFPFKLKGSTVAIFLAVLLFFINYAGSLHWLRSFSNDWYYQQVQQLSVKPGDLVIVEEKWILKDYVRYYHNAEVIATDEAQYTPQMIRERVANVNRNGGKVYINRRDVNSGINTWSVIQAY